MTWSSSNRVLDVSPIRTQSLFARACLWCVMIGILVLVPMDSLFPRDALIAQGRSFPRGIRGLLLVVMCVYIFDMLARGRLWRLPQICQSVLLLSGLIGIHVAIVLPKHPEYIARYMIHLYWVVGLVFFFHVTASGVLAQKVFSGFITVLITLMIICTCADILRWRAHVDGLSGVNAHGYPLLFCLPVLMLTASRRLWLVVTVAAMCVIVYTLKRGVILALLASCIVYAVYQLKYCGAIGRVRAAGAFAVVIMGTAAMCAFAGSALEVRTRDLHSWESMGSGRGTIYRVMWHSWMTGRMSDKVLGYGYRAMPRLLAHELTFRSALKGDVTVEYAHSDWLAVLHDYGLLGVIALAYMHVSIVRLTWTLLRSRADEALPVLLVYVVCFCVHAYSGHIDYATPIYLALSLGYLMGRLGRGVHDMTPIMTTYRGRRDVYGRSNRWGCSSC